MVVYFIEYDDGGCETLEADQLPAFLAPDKGKGEKGKGKGKSKDKGKGKSNRWRPRG